MEEVNVPELRSLIIKKMSETVIFSGFKTSVQGYEVYIHSRESVLFKAFADNVFDIYFHHDEGLFWATVDGYGSSYNNIDEAFQYVVFKILQILNRRQQEASKLIDRMCSLLEVDGLQS